MNKIIFLHYYTSTEKNIMIVFTLHLLMHALLAFSDEENFPSAVPHNTV